MSKPFLAMYIKNIKLSEIFPIVKNYCEGESIASLNNKIGSNSPLLVCDYTEDESNFNAFVQIADVLENMKCEMIICEVFSDGNSRDIDIDILHNLLEAHNETATFVRDEMEFENSG